MDNIIKFSKVRKQQSNVSFLPEFDDFYSFLKVLSYLSQVGSDVVHVDVVEDELTIKVRSYVDYIESEKNIAGTCVEKILTITLDTNPKCVEDLMDSLKYFEETE